MAATFASCSYKICVRNVPRHATIRNPRAALEHFVRFEFRLVCHLVNTVDPLAEEQIRQVVRPRLRDVPHHAERAQTAFDLANVKRVEPMDVAPLRR